MEAEKQEKTDINDISFDESNRLIADFMGRKNDYWYVNNLMSYHFSWDKLIPVVEKIFKLYDDSDHSRWWCKYSFHIRQALSNADLQRTYKAVVEFIKWWNSQKPLPL